MQARGPEYQRGWRTRIAVEDVGVDIVACHAVRTRAPRGHELARQLGRQGRLSMVEDVQHEWRATFDGRRQAVVRRNPNGSFSIDGRHVPSTDLVAAVTAWAGSEIEARSRRSPSP